MPIQNYINNFLTGITLLIGLLFISTTSATVIDFEDLSIAVNTQLSPASGVGVTSQGFTYTPGPNNSSGVNDLHITNQENFLVFQWYNCWRNP